MSTPGPVLYARSRALPQTVAALAATTLLAVWAAHALDSYLDPERRVPVVALAPLVAATAIGTSLHSASDELDRTAVRPWWRRRLIHLLALTALAGALLLEPQRYVVESNIVIEDLTKLYEVLLKHCDVHMGFKLIPQGYPNWVTLTRAYYNAQYVFVTADPAINSVADMAPSKRIGATIGTSAHLQLVSYLTALPQEKRWPTYPYGTNEQALEALVGGAVDVALVWGPSFWSKQRSDPAYANLHVMDPKPLPATVLGVGAIALAEHKFLRNAIDEAIAALSADGTIAKILEGYDFPATAAP